MPTRFHEKTENAFPSAMLFACASCKDDWSQGEGDPYLWLCLPQYAIEMEAKLDQLRSLVEAADRDKVELLNQLEEEKRWGIGLFLQQ